MDLFIDLRLFAATAARCVLATGEFFYEFVFFFFSESSDPCCKADSVSVIVHPLGEQFVDGILVVHGY